MKIIINNMEILNDAQLDNVAGGTYKEYRELLNIMKKDPAGQKYNLHFDGEDDVVSYLRNELGMEAKLNGSLIDYLHPLKDSEPAVYTDKKTGKSLGHSQVLRMARIHAGLDR